VAYPRIVLENETADSINYITEQRAFTGIVGQAVSLGLMPILGLYQNWGVKLGDEYFAGTHLFQTEPDFYWGHDPLDTPEYTAANPWVLLFSGTDNASYFCRHPSSEAAMRWLRDNKAVVTDAVGMMYYNS
jgi:spore cortex formation protein SpoVR/YcgB (stage V sporulation)